MNDKVLKTHSFIFNSNTNGGEQLILTTKFYDNGDDTNNIYTNQELTLNSYCNSASFNLYGCQITPDALRDLANQLDKVLASLKK